MMRCAAETAAIAAALAPLRARAEGCSACDLHRGRRQVVFGAGSARAGLLLIGEAPGASEDATGLPFVGRSGKLLTQLLSEIGLAREDIFIANVLKCRPPANRAPKPDEARACAPLLSAQIELLRPSLILALGLSAARWLLGGKAPMSVLRQGEHQYHGTRTLVTFHPAALLRNPNLRAEATADFARLRGA